MRDLNDYEQKYSEQPYERFQAYFRKRKIMEILSAHKHDVLLEVGCGLDSIFNHMDGYRKLYVIEPGNTFYQQAVKDREKASCKNDITILHKTLEEGVVELSKVTFDFILLSGLLHEVPNPAQILNAVYQLCSPQTVVHINVPNARSFHRMLAVEMGLIKSEFERSDSNIEFQQFSVFSMDTLSQLVDASGFRVTETGSYSFKPFTHRQMEDMIKSGLITQDMLEGLYKMEKYLPGLGSEIFLNAVKK